MTTAARRRRSQDGGSGQARPQQRGSIPRVRRARDDQPRDVAQHAEPVVVVEVPAEALLVRQPLDPDDERVPVGAAGEELQAGRLAAQLILGVVEVGEVLDLRHRQEPREARAECGAEDGLLVEQRVDNAGPTEPAPDTIATLPAVKRQPAQPPLAAIWAAVGCT